HAVVERVPLRARLPVVAPAEDDSDRRFHRAGAGRRLLLGSAHGRRAPRLDPGRARLLDVRRALRHGADRCREGVSRTLERPRPCTAATRSSPRTISATRGTKRKAVLGTTRESAPLI